MTSSRFITGFILATLVAFTIRDCKGSEWDTTEKALFAGQVVLQVIDLAQTNYVRSHQDQFKEANGLYGNPPDMARVIVVKSLLVGGLYYLVKDMKPTDRKLVLGVADVIQLGIVGHNMQVGVKVAW